MKNNKKPLMVRIIALAMVALLVLGVVVAAIAGAVS